MTFILSVNGKESIWLLADRRLSSCGKPVSDSAQKIMFLNTPDGIAILGYAGLGSTPVGNEPSGWMSRVLRGKNFLMEGALNELSKHIENQIPFFLNQLNNNNLSHQVIIPAIVNSEVRYYSINLIYSARENKSKVFFNRHLIESPTSKKNLCPRIFAAGSGEKFFHSHIKKWDRDLLNIVNAYDKKKISGNLVAEFLANINFEISNGTIDNSVGPNSIVAWRNRKEGSHKGGGAHQFYSGIKRDKRTLSIPNIGNGMDIQAIIGVFSTNMDIMLKNHNSGKNNELLSTDELNKKLAQLPETPDEKLR